MNNESDKTAFDEFDNLIYSEFSIKNEFEDVYNMIKDFNLYRGDQINRWTTRNCIKTETDTTHQCIVAQMTIFLCEFFSIDTKTYKNAVSLACIHDMFEYAEGGMGDIPHAIKEKSPEIKKIVEDHERDVIRNIPYFGPAYDEYCSDSLAVKIVDLADALDVLLYIDREFVLGNNSQDFKEIYAVAQERVLKNYKELKDVL